MGSATVYRFPTRSLCSRRDSLSDSATSFAASAWASQVRAARSPMHRKARSLSKYSLLRSLALRSDCLALSLALFNHRASAVDGCLLTLLLTKRTLSVCHLWSVLIIQTA